MARRMIVLGARILIFLSRSGTITPTIQEMIDELFAKGCTVKVFACDVSNKERMAEVFAECANTLPPIKGCIQGSMVLKDVMFENMSYEGFQSAVKPKVHGSWNLHDLLPRDMEFFVLLSSGTGILGNRSQANFAAGNTYQDALPRFPVFQGLPAAYLDLGTVLSVGYVAENLDKTMMARHLGTILEVLREDEIHVLIEYLMDPRSNLKEPNCQLTSGLTDMSTYLSYPLFTHLRTESTSLSSNTEDNAAYAVQALLAAETTLDGAATVVLNVICAKLSSLLAIPLQNVNPSKTVSSNGVDSLVAMEFRTYVVKDLLADVTLLEVMGTGSLQGLSRTIASSSKLVHLSEKGGK